MPMLSKVRDGISFQHIFVEVFSSMRFTDLKRKLRSLQITVLSLNSLMCGKEEYINRFFVDGLCL